MEGKRPDATGPPEAAARAESKSWALRGWGFPRSLDDLRFIDVAAILLVALTIWGYVDVTHRGRILPGKPEAHRTDFTVFTEAGAAFFDGRDPYRVTNPRGWYYLYPPLFGLMVAPLSALDAASQVGVWYVVSVLLGFGCFFESRRLWQWLTAHDPRARWGGEAPPDLSLYVGGCVALAVFLPALECLQRGQLGIALLYPLLLGLRLACTGQAFGTWVLGGIVLAWPVVIKLIPALPVGLLVFQQWAAAVSPARTSRSVGRAAGLSLGLAAGAVLFVLVIPAASLGWSRNLHYLGTWARKVATSDDVGREAKFHIDSIRNQSLGNATHLLVDRIRGPVVDPIAQRYWLLADTLTAERRRADHATQHVIQGARVALLAILAIIGSVMGWRRDVLGQAAAFGLACLATLLVSPLAWTHYYVFLQPALLLMPLWLAQRGWGWSARVLPLAAVVLVWSHYLAMPRVGPVGLLGLGTAAWFLAACALAVLGCRWNPDAKPGCSSKRRADSAHESAPRPRGISLLTDSQHD